MLIHIHAHDLPTVVPHSADRAGTPLVGVQRKAEPEQLQDRTTATGHWTLEAELVTRPDGTLDLRGPYVRGRRGDRFVYLTWGFALADGGFEMVRRTKLMFDVVDERLLREAEQTGHPLVASLGLSAKDGTPLAAAVRPPAISWAVEPCTR